MDTDSNNSPVYLEREDLQENMIVIKINQLYRASYIRLMSGILRERRR